MHASNQQYLYIHVPATICESLGKNHRFLWLPQHSDFDLFISGEFLGVKVWIESSKGGMSTLTPKVTSREPGDT